MLAVKSEQVEASKNEIALLSNAWNIDWSSLKLVSKLAVGGYGEVWRGWLNGTYEVAVKKMFDTSDVDFRDEREIRFLQRARHPRLVMFIGCGRIDDSGDLFVVLEYMDRGDLTKFLVEAQNDAARSKPKWTVRMQCLRDIAEGMQFLHEKMSAIHRDLKTDNCLLALDKERDALRCKVADFGLSRLLKSKAERGVESEADVVEPAKKTYDVDTRAESKSFISSMTMTVGVGTAKYLAPEIVKDLSTKRVFSTYDRKVDVYAFGIILWQTLALKIPWTEYNFMHEMHDAVVSGQRPKLTRELLRDAPAGYVDLMKKCWSDDPETRPEFGAILSRLTTIRAGGVSVAVKSACVSPRAEIELRVL